MTDPPVRAVVFDLDGLLVDTESVFESVARRMLAARDRTLAAEVMRAMLGRPSAQGFAYFREYYGLTESPDALIDEARALFFAAIDAAGVPLMPGVVTLLDRVERRRLPRAIATSSGRTYLERILAPHALLPRFALALTCDDVRQAKPDPEIYEKAAGRLGVAPAEMVVLEDSLNGLRAAKAAGARCIVVPHAMMLREELSAADAVLPSLEASELAELLGLAGL